MPCDNCFNRVMCKVVGEPRLVANHRRPNTFHGTVPWISMDMAVKSLIILPNYCHLIYFFFLAQGYSKRLVKYLAEMISYYAIPKMYQPGEPVQKELRIILKDFLVTPWWLMMIPFLKSGLIFAYPQSPGNFPILHGYITVLGGILWWCLSFSALLVCNLSGSGDLH